MFASISAVTQKLVPWIEPFHDVFFQGGNVMYIFHYGLKLTPCNFRKYKYIFKLIKYIDTALSYLKSGICQKLPNDFWLFQD